MTAKAFPLSPVVRSAILESTARLIKTHRDPVTGEIFDKALTTAVIADLAARAEQAGSEENIARLGKFEAWPYAVYHIVREHIRTSKKPFETHSREHKAATASRQRLLVTFRDATGQIVTKDRRYLRKDELPIVWTQYERLGRGHFDVAEWCRSVWQQMEMQGLADADLVGKVVTLIDEDEDGTAMG